MKIMGTTQTQRKQFRSELKAKVALAAIKGDRTANEISSAFSVHPTQIGIWKKQALEGLTHVFAGGRRREARDQEELVGALYQQIGQQKVELDWLKKKCGQLL